MSRVGLVAVGGTIDSLGADRLDLAFYTEHHTRLPDGELVRALPELATVAEIIEVPYRRVPSYALGPADWTALAAEADRLHAVGCAGVVVTHGTNTLEETAYALHLTARAERPVVLVGAMRPANALGSDGALNLLNAVRVAADPRASGVLVVVGEGVHEARWVTKTTTFASGAFASPDTGPVGHVDADGTVALYHRPAPPGVRFPAEALSVAPRVDLVTSHVGADGALIDAAVAAGAAGLVVAATGAGRCTPAEDEAIDRATAAGVVVCLTTRVGAGRVARSPQMRARDLVTVDRLPPWKARILLGLALTRTRDPREVQQCLHDEGGGR